MWFTKSVAMLLLALWLPVTMHCTLETVPGFSFLQWCCGEDECEQTPSNCGEEICGEVESGSYRLEENPNLAPGLVLLVAIADCDRITRPLAAPAPRLVPASSAPPELPRFWQFHYRMALPPRAPSLIG
jgi:hypothetical protein